MEDEASSLKQIKPLLSASCQFNMEHDHFIDCSECGKTVCLECLDFDFPVPNNESLKYICATCKEAEHSIINKRFGQMMACCMLCIVLIVVLVLVATGI